MEPGDVLEVRFVAHAYPKVGVLAVIRSESGQIRRRTLVDCCDLWEIQLPDDVLPLTPPTTA